VTAGRDFGGKKILEEMQQRIHDIQCNGSTAAH